MALNWCEGLKKETYRQGLTSERRYYVLFLHCRYLLQLFVNLKVTNKQNTICSSLTHKSHFFIDFPVCNPSQQFPFPVRSRRIRRREKLFLIVYETDCQALVPNPNPLVPNPPRHNPNPVSTPIKPKGDWG